MDKKRGKGRPKLELREDQLRQVEALAGIGCSTDQIAAILGVSESTLERRAREEKAIFDALRRGRAVAGSKVLKAAYDMASSGKCPSMTQFWLKCRLKWQDQPEPQPAAVVNNLNLALMPRSKVIELGQQALAYLQKGDEDEIVGETVSPDLE